jgi:hypothetical protein
VIKQQIQQQIVIAKQQTAADSSRCSRYKIADVKR